MILFYLLGIALAACAGFLNVFDSLAFLNSFGLLECISAALLIYACTGFKKIKLPSLIWMFLSAIIISLAAATLVVYLSLGASQILAPMNMIYISQALCPYFIAIPITLCLLSKKDPITIATIAISLLSVFILVTNCLSIFATYDHFDFDAFKFYTDDISNEFTKMYADQNIGILAQKVFVSFMTRMSVSLLPGIFIMLAVVQVFIVLLIIRFLLKSKIKKFNKGPWGVSLSMVSAIINIICIISFMSSFLSTSVTVFSAVAGNVMLILAPASIFIGFIFLLMGFHKGGIFNVICSALPLLMLLVAPPLALIYISFIGSSSIIFTRIGLAIFKNKS